MAIESMANRNEPLPDDYEPCGECGYDHSYEYVPASYWHAGYPDEADRAPANT